MMDDFESLNIAVPAALSQRIVDEYKERGIHEVTLTGKDLYQSMPAEDMFGFDVGFRRMLPIGSLADDLRELSTLLNDLKRCPSAVDMERPGNVLRAGSQVLAE